jgi:CRP-like cAMP-binding protein
VTLYSVAGKEVSFRDLGPGEVFGEYAAIDHSPRSASVVALTGRAGPNERGPRPLQGYNDAVC